MSLICVMYHHVNSDDLSNDLEMFDKHLEYISNNFISVFPGEKLAKNSICLTFDDAYADFYFLVYPLLKKYNLKAILGVPTKFILQSTSVEPKKRMSFKHNAASQNYKFGSHTTFDELKEMIDSSLIQVASHSHSHIVLTDEGVDLNLELKHSKEILESNLNIKVDSFIFPFGKYNKNILNEAKKHYKYNFRIGSAIQKDFKGINGVIYRIKGDNLKSPDEIFKFKNMLKYRLKALFKRISQK
ncbi:polysaccharide deacetylase family protein [Campylobacter portucalensis]|nr:polysaccharide deacetylase family protein [Campylobacter portucalensis]